MLNIPRYSRDDMVDALAYAFMKIVPSKAFPKHPTRTYISAYIQAHPLVVRLCWLLRRWIRIKPWIELRSADDADPVYMKAHNTLFMGERTFKLLQAAKLND